ncbi:hypothetical protein C5S42_05920 [Candidatus Methanomarinus sp.]|nr:hypothetical protein C5S42_05920 [ANME-2 cluster archaeon]
MCVRRNTGDTLNERKRTAKKKSFKSEVSIMKEKEAQEAQEVLLEYYIQTTEDCRTVGNQKYQVLVSIAIALAGILYAAVRINDIQPSPILGLLDLLRNTPLHKNHALHLPVPHPQFSRTSGDNSTTHTILP